MATYTGSDKRLQYLFRASRNLAEDYNDTSTYAVGDFAIVDGVLKKCITAVSTPESYDSTKWTDALITDEMGGGGGGTTVIANPSGTPTDDLETIQIGSTIYDIVGGGSSGSGLKWGDAVFPTSYSLKRVNDTYTVQNTGVVHLRVRTNSSSVRVSYYVKSSNGDVIYALVWSNNGNDSGLNIPCNKGDVLTVTYVENILDVIISEIPLEGSIIELASCYSTEEKQVGCWIDGKPLYQKSIINTGADIVCNGTTWTSICSESWISDVDKIVWGCLTRQAYSTSAAALVTPCEFQKNISNNTIQINPFRNMTFKSGAYFTIQYTKAADTAGSGIWTPSGSYAHHYSTAEQVIGTWTDGSTLYEKTLHIPFSDTSTEGVQRVYSIANALPNTVIRNVFGIATSATYGYCSLGSMCYKQNTQSGTYWQFYWYYNLLALRASEGITTLNNSIKPDIDVTVQYTKTA